MLLTRPLAIALAIATALLAVDACGTGDAAGTDAGPGAEASAGDGAAGSDAGDAGNSDDASADSAASDAAGDAATDATDGGAAQAIGIPMYLDPTASAADWTQATAGAPTVALLVANPNSGPGAAADAQYTQAIARAHGAGQTIVGYVHTSYAARPLAQVEADVDAWYGFYPAVDGVFVDETSTDAATVGTYYKPLFDHVKAESGGPRVVVINPGTLVAEPFMTAADVVVTFEDTYAHYTDGTYPPNPAWMAGYARWRFWHLVLSAPTAAAMQNAVTIARQRNAGYVYVTDQGPATAYSQLVTGAYWQAELAAVAAP
ncbi:MAG TPA: spherulation-specific family 4 protein [Polyangiaceae bacterium]|jgi:hypothetical protein